MKNHVLGPLALGIVFFSFAAVRAQSQAPGNPNISQIVCYVVIQAGSSDEGDALFLQKMAVDTEASKRIAPTRFSLVAHKFRAASTADVRYQAGSPELVRSSKGLSLYSVPLRFFAPAYPMALRVVTVNFFLGDLTTGGDLVQPSLEAMRLAVAKSGLSSGSAWIVGMDMPSPGAFRAKVGLSK
jgi:hypothetical protein